LLVAGAIVANFTGMSSFRIRPFIKGCYRLSDYAAYYAMNKLAECALEARKDKKDPKLCLKKYLKFRREGIEEFHNNVER